VTCLLLISDFSETGRKDRGVAVLDTAVGFT